MNRVTFSVNGVERTLDVEPGERLLDVLRVRLGLTGTKEGCGIGACGACTVLVDGRAENACLVPAASLEGAHVTTIEGLSEGDTVYYTQVWDPWAWDMASGGDASAAEAWVNMDDFASAGDGEAGEYGYDQATYDQIMAFDSSSVGAASGGSAG